MSCDKVALVAGATRGAGRGMLVDLGPLACPRQPIMRGSHHAASGNPILPSQGHRGNGRAGQAAGRGVAVRVVTSSSPPRWSMQAEQGRLDILVNDVWGGRRWHKPVWPPRSRQRPATARTRCAHHLITAHHALHLLIEHPGGLLIEVTDGTAAYNATNYRLNPAFYDLAKSSIIRLAWAHARDLAPHAATAVSLTPGRLRSEMMLDAFGVKEANWRDALARVRLPISDHPLRRPRRRRAGPRPGALPLAGARSLYSGQPGRGLRLYRPRRLKAWSWRYVVEVRTLDDRRTLHGYR